MTSWHGNAFYITGCLWGKSIFIAWFPPQGGGGGCSNVELWCFFVVSLNKLLNNQSNYQWFKTRWRSCDCNMYIETSTIHNKTYVLRRWCFGSKWCSEDWIVSQIPMHLLSYVLGNVPPAYWFSFSMPIIDWFWRESVIIDVLVLLCLVVVISLQCKYLSISFRVASLELGLSYNSPLNTNEITTKDMHRINHSLAMIKHNKRELCA